MADCAEFQQSPSSRPRRKHPRAWLRDLLLKHSSDYPLVPPDLRSTALVVAPMVDASELPYRLLTRRHGANICFTPMIHAKMFLEKPGYRRRFWREGSGMPAEDRPLIAQFCGHDKDVMLAAMRIVQGGVDGVDVNCGCPQGIARRGRYGAFLLEEGGGDRVVEIVRHLSANLDVPVSVKVRILPSGPEDSLALYERLVEAGAAMITIHGRTRLQKQRETGRSDWDLIGRAVRQLGDRVPVVANGSVMCMDDVRQCLAVTGADGVMSSEAILEYPPLFTETNVESTDYRRTGPGRLRMARDYLELCRRHPPQEGGQGSGMKCVRSHLHRFLHADLQRHTEARDVLVEAFSMEAADDVVRLVGEIHERDGHEVEGEGLSWYLRHRGSWDENWEGGGGIAEEKKAVTEQDEEDEEEGCPCEMFGEVCEEDGDY